MISVPNHQQLLNGNSWLLFFIFVFLTSCGASKQVPSRNTQVVKADKNSTNTKSKSVPIDTVIWEEAIDENSSPINDDMVKNEPNKSKQTDIKSNYNILMYIPLNSQQYLSSDGSSEIYLEYYSGMKLAAYELNTGGTYINIDVKDSALNSGLPADGVYDVIIAPNDKNAVASLIEYGKKNDALIISPWYSNSKITENNPNYLQLRPNLKEHFNKIAKHVSENFKEGEVALVGLDEKSYKGWFNYFQEAGKSYYNTKDQPFVEHFVIEDSLALGERVFRDLIESGVKTFILPNYSFRDENHVYSVLRRLNAEKGMDNIQVYGMPMLLESDKINYDYYNNLNIKLAISEYVDLDKSEVQYFRKRYFDTYGDLPGKDAFEGYDLLTFLAESLNVYGTNFPAALQGQPKKYLQTTFDIQNVSRDNEGYELTDKVDFYENKHLNIIEFKDGKFRKTE